MLDSNAKFLWFWPELILYLGVLVYCIIQKTSKDKSILFTTGSTHIFIHVEEARTKH